MAETNGNGKHIDMEKLNPNERSLLINGLLDVANARSSSWQQFMNRLIDPRRDLDAECGYPPTAQPVSAYTYKDLYDRDALGNRVVSVLPKESWQAQPKVYEDEDTTTATEFEEAWDELGKMLEAGLSWHKDEDSSPVWNHLLHADILSGIGYFGILLMGLDDGKPMQVPVDGVLERPDSPMTEEEEKNLRDPKEQTVKTTDARGKVTEQRLAKATPLNNYESMVLNTWAKERREYESKVEPTTNRTIHEALQSVYPSNLMYPMGGSQMGTDAQYFGVQLGVAEKLSEEVSTEKRKLIFLQAFDESLVQIVRYEWDAMSPRFGMPVMYRVTLNDPKTQHGGIGLPLSTIFVHWSRVIHLTDNNLNASSSKVFAPPRQQAVLNRILDARKTYGAGAEGYWKAAVTGFSVTTHPQLGPDAKIDRQSVKDVMEQYGQGLQRYIAGEGFEVNTLAPVATDLTPYALAQIQAICIQLGIPQRVFMGSERGELASSQDDASWNDRLDQRRKYYITPKIIVPFINRLIQIGVLPQPEQYRVEWPDLDSLTDTERATIANTRTTAMGAYVSGGLDALMAPLDYLVHELHYDEEQAQQILDSAEEHQTEKTDMLGEQGFDKAPPPGFVDPEAQQDLTDKAHQVAMTAAKNPGDVHQHIAPPHPGQPPGAGPPKPGGPPVPPQKGPPKPPTANEEQGESVETVLNMNPNHDEQGKFSDGGSGGKKQSKLDKLQRGGETGGSSRAKEAKQLDWGIAKAPQGVTLPRNTEARAEVVEPKSAGNLTSHTLSSLQQKEGETEGQHAERLDKAASELLPLWKEKTGKSSFEVGHTSTNPEVQRMHEVLSYARSQGFRSMKMDMVHRGIGPRAFHGTNNEEDTPNEYAPDPRIVQVLNWCNQYGGTTCKDGAKNEEYAKSQERKDPKYWGGDKQPFWRPGKNPTVDNVITRHNPKTGHKEVLLIKRATEAHGKPVAEGGKWALPGGFHDSDSKLGEAWTPGKETSKQASLRELQEETGMAAHELAPQMRRVGVFKERGRDPRDNAEAWSHSTAFHLHLDRDQAAKHSEVHGTDDASDARWHRLDKLPKMAFDHARIIRKAGV